MLITTDELTLDLLGIGRTGIVCIDLLGRRILIQRYEAVQQILARKIVVITTGVVWEVIPQRRVWKLVRE